MNAIDNVNAVRFAYQWVPWKNIILMAGYDRIKPINAAAVKTNRVSISKMVGPFCPHIKYYLSC